MGIGKTTTAKVIAADLKYHLLEENFKENPFLKDAAKDPDHYALPSQIHFLMEKRQQNIVAQQLLKKEGVVQDTPLEQDVFSYARALLYGPQWDEYFDLYKIFQEKLAKPSLVVCLETSVLVNMERIHERGRDFENDVTMDYVKRLTELNYEWIKKSGIPVVFIQTDNLNIVQSAVARKKMIDIVRKQL